MAQNMTQMQSKMTPMMSTAQWAQAWYVSRWWQKTQQSQQTESAVNPIVSYNAIKSNMWIDSPNINIESANKNIPTMDAASQELTWVNQNHNSMQELFSAVYRQDQSLLENSPLREQLGDASYEKLISGLQNSFKNPQFTGITASKMIEKMPELASLYNDLKDDRWNSVSEMFSYQIYPWDKMWVSKTDYDKYLEEYNSNSIINRVRKRAFSQVKWDTVFGQAVNALFGKTSAPTLQQYIEWRANSPEWVKWEAMQVLEDMNALTSVVLGGTEPLRDVNPLLGILEEAEKEFNIEWEPEVEPSIYNAYENLNNDLIENWLLDQDRFNAAEFLTEIGMTSTLFKKLNLSNLTGTAWLVRLVQKYPQIWQFINRSKFVNKLLWFSMNRVEDIVEQNIASYIEWGDSASMAENIMAMAWWFAIKDIPPALQKFLLQWGDQMKKFVQRMPLKKLEWFLESAKQYSDDLVGVWPMWIVRNSIWMAYNKLRREVSDVWQRVTNLKDAIKKWVVSVDTSPVIETPQWWLATMYDYVVWAIDEMWYLVNDKWDIVSKPWVVWAKPWFVSFLNNAKESGESFIQSVKTYTDNPNPESLVNLYEQINEIYTNVPANSRYIIDTLKKQIRNKMPSDLVNLLDEYSNMKQISDKFQKAFVANIDWDNVDIKWNMFNFLFNEKTSWADSNRAIFDQFQQFVWNDYTADIAIATYISKIMKISEWVELRPSLAGALKAAWGIWIQALQSPNTLKYYSDEFVPMNPKLYQWAKVGGAELPINVMGWLQQAIQKFSNFIGLGNDK